MKPVSDCDVYYRPWALEVSRDGNGELFDEAGRAPIGCQPGKVWEGFNLGKVSTWEGFNRKVSTCPDARTMQALTPGRTSKAPDTDCPALGIPDKGNHALRRYFITYARRGGARKDMLERVTHNASGDILDVYTDADGIWPALCEAVLCLKVQWPRDNILQLPLAASAGWDKRTDKLGHEIEKRSEGAPFLAPAVGLEPTTKRLTVARSTN